MKIKVIKIKVNNLSDLIDAIKSDQIIDVKNYCCPSEMEKQNKLSVELAIQRIADKKGWKFEKTNRWLGEIAEINTMAAVNIIARELALELDKKYKDHIENSEEIYIISSLDGRIHKAPKANIKNYRNFAAFRTLEDAKEACKILRIPLKNMFKGGRKQKD